MIRPLRVWSTGWYWRWQCRICYHTTKDFIPSLPMAYDDAVYHLAGHGEEENDDD